MHASAVPETKLDRQK